MHFARIRRLFVGVVVVVIAVAWFTSWRIIKPHPIPRTIPFVSRLKVSVKHLLFNFSVYSIEKWKATRNKHTTRSQPISSLKVSIIYEKYIYIHIFRLSSIYWSHVCISYSHSVRSIHKQITRAFESIASRLRKSGKSNSTAKKYFVSIQKETKKKMCN